MASPAGDVDDKKQIRDSEASLNRSSEQEPSPGVEEFFKRLIDKQEGPPGFGEEAIAAALQAIQGLGSAPEPPKEKSTVSSSNDLSPEGLPVCRGCGHHNQVENQFCGMCGEPLGQSAETGSWRGAEARGRHQFHHHYHHHYFEGGPRAELAAAALGQRPAGSTAAKDLGRVRASLGGPAVSRAEATLRQITQDWALACNNKQLDDLVALYATDALVLRPNISAIRGTAAIREFFCAALDSGLGDVEMEPFRVELLGEVAYEAGRCKMLVPVAVGKRREERGKYVLVFARQKTGEWKAVVDSWSSDLTLNPAEVPPKPGPLPPGSAPRIRR